MRGFFSQFGGVKRLRLARSKKSGRSKHYAFIQFEVRCQYRAARLACSWPVTNSTVLLLLLFTLYCLLRTGMRLRRLWQTR